MSVSQNINQQYLIKYTSKERAVIERDIYDKLKYLECEIICRIHTDMKYGYIDTVYELDNIDNSYIKHVVGRYFDTRSFNLNRILLGIKYKIEEVFKDKNIYVNFKNKIGSGIVVEVWTM
jgi:hypothetical protein